MKSTRMMWMVGALIVLALVFVGVLFLRGGGLGVIDEERIVVASDEGELSVDRSGAVEYRTSEGLYVDKWSREKTEAFFAYYLENYEGAELAEEGSGETVTVNGVTYDGNGDELTQVVIDELTGGGGEEEEEGEDISEYFGGQSPTPTPTPTPSGGDGIPDDCLFWRLSYCAKLKPTPTPTPTPSGVPGGILPPECGDNESTGRTVISNELCVEPVVE